MIATAQDLTCDVRVDCDGWAEIEPGPIVELCFHAVRKTNATASRPVSVLFTDDAAMAEMNEVYRAKTGPTNVLSFPAGDGVLGDEAYLGDIALALETARSEAAVRGVSLRDHAAHLLVHGMLHLIGYDHEDEAAAAAMEAEETRILQSIGASDPYAAGLIEER